MDLTLNYQVVDIVELNDGYEVLTIPTDFYNVKKILIDHQYQIYEAEIKLISKNKIANLSSEIESKLERFIESCNLDDDIQSVVTNYDF
jgi:transcriptional/translational regulatory protein YebC/TACO1